MRASEIRRGQAVMIDGKLFVVTNADHNTPATFVLKFSSSSAMSARVRSWISA